MLRGEQTGFDSRQNDRYLPFPLCLTALDHTQILIQWLPRTLSLNIKRRGEMTTVHLYPVHIATL
jgi:hypothetical protein